MLPAEFAASAFREFQKLFDAKENELREHHSRALAEIQQKTLSSFEVALNNAVQQFLTRLGDVEEKLEKQGKALDDMHDAMCVVNNNVAGLQESMKGLRAELLILVRQEIARCQGRTNVKLQEGSIPHGICVPDLNDRPPTKIRPGWEKYWSASVQYHNKKGTASDDTSGTMVNSRKHLSEVAAAGVVVSSLIQDFDELMQLQRQIAHQIIVAPLIFDDNMEENGKTSQDASNSVESLAGRFSKSALEAFLSKHLPSSTYELRAIPKADRMFLVAFSDVPFRNKPAAWCVKNWQLFRQELGVWVRFDASPRLRALELTAKQFGRFIVNELAGVPGIPKRAQIMENRLVLRNLVIAPLLLIPDNKQMWFQLLPSIKQEFVKARPSWLSIRERANRAILEQLCRLHEQGDIDDADA